MKLNDAEVGKTYVVKKIGEKGPLRRRVMDMGLTKGTEFYVRKVAPLGDPVQISLRNYELSIRKHDSEIIEIEEVES